MALDRPLSLDKFTEASKVSLFISEGPFDEVVVEVKKAVVKALSSSEECLSTYKLTKQAVVEWLKNSQETGDVLKRLKDMKPDTDGTSSSRDLLIGYQYFIVGIANVLAEETGKEEVVMTLMEMINIEDIQFEVKNVAVKLAEARQATKAIELIEKLKSADQYSMYVTAVAVELAKARNANEAIALMEKLDIKVDRNVKMYIRDVSVALASATEGIEAIELMKRLDMQDSVDQMYVRDVAVELVKADCIDAAVGLMKHIEHSYDYPRYETEVAIELTRVRQTSVAMALIKKLNKTASNNLINITQVAIELVKADCVHEAVKLIEYMAVQLKMDKYRDALRTLETHMKTLDVQSVIDGYVAELVKHDPSLEMAISDGSVALSISTEETKSI